MLLTIEKVIVLKGAEVFSVLPDRVLAFVASIVEEVYVQRGETFIQKGDVGDCMYLIVHGTVRVHDGDRAIVEMGAGQTVGELAVLDPEPRVASVTAVEETHLFRIEKDAFDEVMADHPEIAREIIRILCQRLRGVSQSKEPPRPAD
jgi:CRP/FNR family transcriptional regulator, cyclic AMP receptor protein